MGRVARAVGVVAVVAACAGDARAQLCPAEPELEESPASKHWFEGTIGRSPVRVHFERGGKVVVGVYYYVRHRKPLLLVGGWAGEGEIRLSERTATQTETGVIEGRVGPDGFAGTWASAEGNKRLPVRLRTVPEPGCDGAGPWRTFNDPRWPWTFSYPASWRIDVSDHYVELTCPDPALMLYEDTAVNIRRGDDPATVEDAHSMFLWCPEAGRHRWMMSTESQVDCACPGQERPASQTRDAEDEDSDQEGERDAEGSDFCVPAAPTTSFGMTVLEGSANGRGYCTFGGYVGVTGDSEHLFLRGTSWIQITAGPWTGIAQRLSTTIRPRPRPDGGR
jgi:hypothetical protein